MKDVILTPEVLQAADKQELESLRTTERREIAERIAAAREFGEIAENAEYDDAKNEQVSSTGSRSSKSGWQRPRDRHERVDTSVVSVGSGVRLRDVDAKQTSSTHRGLRRGKPRRTEALERVPVGKAIIGRKKGETVEVVTPRGSR